MGAKKTCRSFCFKAWNDAGNRVLFSTRYLRKGRPSSCWSPAFICLGAPPWLLWLWKRLSCRRYSHDFALIVNEITFLWPRWCPLVMPEQKKLMQEHLQPGVHTEILWQKGGKKLLIVFRGAFKILHIEKSQIMKITKTAKIVHCFWPGIPVNISWHVPLLPVYFKTDSVVGRVLEPSWLSDILQTFAFWWVPTTALFANQLSNGFILRSTWRFSLLFIHCQQTSALQISLRICPVISVKGVSWIEIAGWRLASILGHQQSGEEAI